MIRERYCLLSPAARASFWALIASLVQKGVSVLATPIFTRLLTTEQYAQYTLYQSWHDIILIFTTFNVTSYATYTAMVKFEDDQKGFLTSAQTFMTVLTIIAFSIYYVLSRFFGDLLGFSLPIIALMMLDILFISAFNLWGQYSRFQFRYRVLTFCSVLMGILNVVIGVLFVQNSADRGVARIYSVALINIGLGAFFYIYNIFQSRRFYFRNYWKYIVIFCVPLIPHFLSSQILSRADRIMIDSMCGATQAAIYALAYNLASLMLLINEAVLNALTPYSYQMIRDEKPEKIRIPVRSAMIIIASANIGVILLAPEVVAIFAPSEYQEAIHIIPSVAASSFFIFLFNLFANIEYYYSETKAVAAASVSAAILNIMLNYVFITIFGYIAAGYVTLVCYMFLALGHYLLMKRTCRKHANGYQFYDKKEIFVFAVIMVAVSILILPLYQNDVARYTVLIIGMLLVIWKRKTILQMLKQALNR